jgi:DNA-binding NarL/FixJ family response regulator
MIRTIIAEDHTLVRQGLLALIEKEPDIEIVGEASNGQEALDLAEKTNPEVLVMDLSMPRLDGAQAAARLLNGKTAPAIVILSVHADSVLAHQLIRQGVKGYLLKMSSAQELPLAIRAAARGELYLSPAITDSVIQAVTSDNAALKGAAELLSPREREVLQLISEGHTNSSTAEILGISLKTVEKHRANLMSKLEVHDLPSLIRTAIRLGLILDES